VLPVYRFKWVLDARAAHVRPDGHFDLARSLATLEALDDARQPGRVLGLIWDVRDRTDCPSASEIQALVNHFDRWERVVVLSRPDVQYTMAQMAALLSNRVAAATTTSEALAWIRGGADGLSVAT
jgi:hypothetical protein